MPEEVLFETERRQSRQEIAAYLERVAERLANDEPISLQRGEQSVTLDPPASPTFEVKVEREGAADAGELSIEFEIEWPEGESDGGNLSIE